MLSGVVGSGWGRQRHNVARKGSASLKTTDWETCPTCAQRRLPCNTLQGIRFIAETVFPSFRAARLHSGVTTVPEPASLTAKSTTP